MHKLLHKGEFSKYTEAVEERDQFKTINLRIQKARELMKSSTLLQSNQGLVKIMDRVLILTSKRTFDDTSELTGLLTQFEAITAMSNLRHEI